MPKTRVPIRVPIAAVAALAALISAPALAWGKTGHRVVAAIANTQLSGLARAHIREILGPGESLDEAANWPDEMRSDPAQFWQKTATPWHYVTLNGIIYDHTPPEGDALQALDHFTKVLKDPNASLAGKQTALRFVVHLVGDLHQPLHVGKCCDRGGNDVKVTWFGKPTNLHTVWDSQLIDEEQLSFTELAAKLERHISDRQLILWWDINPRDWISESGELRDTLYPTAADMSKSPKGAKRKKAKGPSVADLSYSYAYRFTPLMERRLSQAGVRLAAYLNAIFAEPQSPPERQGR
jgi:S1/P1 Nuclease